MAARKKTAAETKNTTEAKNTASVVLISAATYSSPRLRGVIARRGIPLQVPLQTAEHLLHTGQFTQCTAHSKT